MCSLYVILPLLIGWVLDLVFGDPARLPHPVVGFGKMIAFGEHRLNKGNHRKLKGDLMAISLIVLVFVVMGLLPLRRILYQNPVRVARGEFDFFNLLRRFPCLPLSVHRLVSPPIQNGQYEPDSR